MASALTVDRHDAGVVLLTLALPDKRNAMTAELTAQWADTVASLRGDRSVRCVVVTGAGRAFCAGGDVSWLASEPDASPADLRDRMLPFYTTWLSLRALDVPSIAAVNGAAVGAGGALALSCDIRYAGAAAKFTMPFAQLGMAAGMASTWLLPEVVGLAAARELLLTGRVVRRAGDAAPGPGQRGLRRRRPAGQGARARRAGRLRRPGGAAVPQDRARRRRPRELRGRPALGGPRPAGHAGDRRPAGGAARPRREAPARSSPAGRPPSGARARRDITEPPGAGPVRLPLANGTGAPGGSVVCRRYEPARTAVNAVSHSLWTTVWTGWGTGRVSLWTPDDGRVDRRRPGGGVRR